MIRYTTDAPADIEPLRQFMAACGWERRTADARRFAEMVHRADRLVIAWDGDDIVGFARALCDGVNNGYVSMLAVGQSHRLRGIGRELVRRVTGDDPHITWVLRAGREGAAEFWERCGFVRSEIAMERTRTV